MAGDGLFNAIHKTNDLLQFSDLPRYINFENRYFSVANNQSYAGCMSSNVVTDVGIDLESCLNMIYSKQRGCILIFNSSAIAIHFDMEEKKYFVFDSHCRGNNGFCDSLGNCVLTTFSSFSILCDFLRQLCMSISSKLLETVQYEAASFCIQQSSRRRHRPSTALGINETFSIQRKPEFSNKATKRQHSIYEKVCSENKTACSTSKRHCPSSQKFIAISLSDSVTSVVSNDENTLTERDSSIPVNLSTASDNELMSSGQDFNINLDTNIPNVINNETRNNVQDEIVSMNDTMPQNDISDIVSTIYCFLYLEITERNV